MSGEKKNKAIWVDDGEPHDGPSSNVGRNGGIEWRYKRHEILAFFGPSFPFFFKKRKKKARLILGFLLV